MHADPQSQVAVRGPSQIQRMRVRELGGVETLVSHPASMTHASVPADRRAAIGLTDSMIRISAGIEDIEDLKEDLRYALS